jgi:hypothetical protein
MNEGQVRTILNALPDKSPCSRLEPYAQLIDELRKHGRTYREIEQILFEKCGIHAPRSTIHDFVRRRSRRKGKMQKSQPARAKDGNAPATAHPEEKKAPLVESRPSAVDEMYRRIDALKQCPAQIAKTTEVFHYDPNEPLHLPTKKERKDTGE